MVKISDSRTRYFWLKVFVELMIFLPINGAPFLSNLGVLCAYIGVDFFEDFKGMDQSLGSMNLLSPGLLSTYF